MPKQTKSRALYILKYLWLYTDDEHPASISDLTDYLAKNGMEAHRTTVSADIAELGNIGIDIIATRKTQMWYHIGNRFFEQPELKLLTDAVSAAKFISEKKSTELIGKLSALASEHQQKQLLRHLFVAGQPKTKNEKVYYIVDAMAAQKRLSEHGVTVSKKREKYLFSKLISCKECGSAYRRKEQNGIYYWVCPKDECPGKRFREDEIQRAFVKMYNRLRQYQKDILDFVLNLLIEARTRMTAQNAEVAQIDADIAKLAGQSEMYHKLHDKRIMDDVSFRERVGDLQNRLTGLRSRRMKLLSAGDEYKCIEQLHQLKDDLEECPPAILSFEKELFDTVVDRMIADENGTMTFVLKGGIRLKETIKES